MPRKQTATPASPIEVEQSGREVYHDQEHRPFSVLLATHPPRQAGTRSMGAVSLVLHLVLGAGGVWATMALAEEVVEEAEEVYVELTTEMDAPPPPPPPVEVEAPVIEDVFRGFQTLAIPTVIPPDIPPPSSSAAITAADFTGEGVAGGRANGRDAPDSVSSVEPDRDRPSFTPMTVRPELTNPDEVTRALLREYPPLLRDAGIGGQVIVWLFLSTEGRVESTRLNRSSGHDQLDEAALRVASVMRFTPAYNRDTRVAVWVAIPVTFRVG